MWMEELYPNFGFKMNLQGEERINKTFIIWNNMKMKGNNKEITFGSFPLWVFYMKKYIYLRIQSLNHNPIQDILH